MNYPCRLISEKDYAYLCKLFNDVRTITGCFILAEGYFSFWLRVISTILPLFHSPLKPSFYPPQKPFWELVSWLSRCSKRTKHFFPYHVTTFSDVLKHFYIRPPLSPTLSTLSFTSLPLNGHFHLKDAWCLSDGMLEMVLSLSPSGGNGFWVAVCNRNTLFRLSERRESGWENEAQLPLANAHLCQQPKWNITSMLEREWLSPNWCVEMAPEFLSCRSLATGWTAAACTKSCLTEHQHCSNPTLLIVSYI